MDEKATESSREALVQGLRDYISQLEDRCDELNQIVWSRTHWRPIDEAPKDGTWMLLGKWAATDAFPDFGIEARPPHLWWAVRGQWSGKWGRWFDGVEPSGLAAPNVWCPLPDAPESAAENHDNE